MNQVRIVVGIGVGMGALMAGVTIAQAGADPTLLRARSTPLVSGELPKWGIDMLIKGKPVKRTALLDREVLDLRVITFTYEIAAPAKDVVAKLNAQTGIKANNFVWGKMLEDRETSISLFPGRFVSDPKAGLIKKDVDKFTTLVVTEKAQSRGTRPKNWPKPAIPNPPMSTVFKQVPLQFLGTYKPQVVTRERTPSGGMLYNFLFIMPLNHMAPRQWLTTVSRNPMWIVSRGRATPTEPMEGIELVYVKPNANAKPPYQTVQVSWRQRATR